MSHFLIDLVRNPSVPRVSSSYRYDLGTILLVDLLYIANTITNSPVLLTESIESNSFNDNLSAFSGEKFNGHHTIYFKDTTSLFYYFRFKW